MARTPNPDIIKNPRKNRIVILEELDFIWDEPELKEICILWESEISIKHIAKQFRRDPDELLLALLHLARVGRIKNRASGLKGEE